jgi:hypothetical protein
MPPIPRPALARKHVGLAHASGDRLRLRSHLAPNIKARQQKGEEEDATPDLVLKHSDATIVTYV